jgi:hypothetical protein
VGPDGANADLPYTEGEYEQYARELASRLLDGASCKEIARYLTKVERKSMGTRPDKSRNAAVAAFVERWFAQSMESWREFGR